MSDTGAGIQVREALERWAPQAGLGPLRITDCMPAVGGMSSETWLLRAETGAGARHDWVLRIEPRTQVYEDPSVARQYRVIAALQGHDGLPVPAPVVLEENPAILGAPFFLMERAAGEAPPNAYHSKGLFAAASPAEREALWSSAVTLLARLHTLDPAPFAFLGWPGGPASDGLAQELARWDSYLNWAQVPILPVYDRARRWLEDNRPAPAGIGFAWGDARPCNILFSGGRGAALLDWETASLGPAETDLGWWLFYDRMISETEGAPRLDGLPDAAATVALWEAASGRRAQALDWHVLFAGWRFAVISERALMLAIRAGHIPSDYWGPANPAVQLLEVLLAENG